MTPQDLVARGLTPELAVFLTSMLPIIELRGALPLAINVFSISWPKAFLIAYVGNMIPAPFILWLLAPAVRLLSKIRIFERFFTWLFDRTRKKSNKMIERYEEIGLVAFVAIPLPGTGAWTGALIAFLFGLDFTQYDWRGAAADFWAAYPSRPGVKRYAELLIGGVVDHREERDAVIAEALENWSPERVGGVERNVLRVAVFEMRHGQDVPRTVAINEAIEVAKRFGADDAPRFVNGVLDRIKET